MRQAKSQRHFQFICRIQRPRECYLGCGASGFLSSGSPAGLKRKLM